MRDERAYATVVACFAAGLYLALLVAGFGLISLATNTEVIADSRAGPLIGPAMTGAAVALLLILLILFGRRAAGERQRVAPGLAFGAAAACYLVFAAAGAFSAGIELEVAQITGGSHLSEVATSFTVTVPIAVFILGIWWIAIRACADRTVNVVVPTGAGLVLLDPVLPIPVTLTAAIVVVIVVVLVLRPPVGKPVASGR